MNNMFHNQIIWQTFIAANKPRNCTESAVFPYFFFGPMWEGELTGIYT